MAVTGVNGLINRLFFYVKTICVLFLLDFPGKWLKE